MNAGGEGNGMCSCGCDEDAEDGEDAIEDDMLTARYNWGWMSGDYLESCSLK